MRGCGEFPSWAVDQPGWELDHRDGLPREVVRGVAEELPARGAEERVAVAPCGVSGVGAGDGQGAVVEATVPDVAAVDTRARREVFVRAEVH